jgi:hypothetical protein
MGGKEDVLMAQMQAIEVANRKDRISGKLSKAIEAMEQFHSCSVTNCSRDQTEYRLAAREASARKMLSDAPKQRLS